MGALLLTALGLLLLMWWEISTLGGSLRDLSVTHTRGMTLANDIKRLDQTLTSTTLLASATNETQWRQLYDASREELDRALAEAEQLTLGTPAAESVAAIRVADDRLTAMEGEAFTLTRGGQPGLAHDILHGTAYVLEQTRYQDALDRFSQIMRARSAESFAKAASRADLSWTLAAATIPLLTIVSLILALILIRALRALRRSQTMQESARKSLASLASDAVAELEESKQELENEIETRKRAEAAIALSEKKYRSLVETTGTGFAIVDDEGRILDANDSYVAITGHATLAEIKGRPVSDWTAPDFRGKNEQAFRSLKESGVVRNLEVDYIDSRGKITPVEIFATRVPHEDTFQTLSLVRDISERRRGEQILKDNEERLSMALRGGRLGFWDWDVPSGRVLYNREWASILGFDLDEIDPSFRFWRGRLHPDDKAKTIRAAKDLLDGTTEVFEVEHRLISKQGEHVWVLGVGRISKVDDDGAPLRVTGVMLDISQRKLAETALAESERRFRNVALTSGDWIWQVDAQGRYSYVSETVTRILGYTPDEIIGKRPLDLMPEDEAARVAPLLESHIQTRSPLVDIENWNRAKDGSLICLLTNGVPIFDDDLVFAGYFGTDKDITDRKRSEHQLKLFGKVFESALEGITITDAQGTIIAVNQAFTEITGYASREALGQTPRLLRSNRHDADFYRRMWASLEETGTWEGEIWNRRKNGEAYPEWLSISAINEENGLPTHYVAVFHDITEMKRKEELIEHQAYHDALTGLPNRLLLLDRLTLAMTRARRARSGVGLLFLDLDNFKSVNDSLGHAVGDMLLVETARRLSEAVRDSDTVSRLGGDEFVVLMDDLEDEADTLRTAERLLKSMEPSFLLEGRELFMSTSIGIAVFPRDGDEPGTLIRNADIAMYRAKEHGRNQYNMFTSTMNAVVQRRIELERDMRIGLAENHFFLLYQPKVDIRTGRTVGMEALVRWRRGDEIVSPNEFIPLAEKTGLIRQLGEQVAAMGLTECAPLLKQAQCLRLSLNLSPREFQQSDLLERLAAQMETHGIEPHCLEIEVTETAMLTDAEEAIDKLKRLAATGVTISMDDFGTGYSSLSYVKRLPVHTLKVDRSFVTGLGTDESDESIIKTIIQLARNFDMTVLAEGVETREQLAILAALGCDQVQGYYFSKPVGIDELQEFIRKTNG
jgi:diguanylate cyclase (GGDEF)-like protein/PAS domain S-box-containing protein